MTARPRSFHRCAPVKHASVRDHSRRAPGARYRRDGLCRREPGACRCPCGQRISGRRCPPGHGGLTAAATPWRGHQPFTLSAFTAGA
jgi:hypothetical protein